MGLPGPHPGSRVHPNDRRRALFGCLHGQLEVERVPGNPRAHLRPSVRARVPARPRRGREPAEARAGGDLPPEARRSRLQGSRRDQETRCPSARKIKRKKDRLHRRGPGVAHRRARPRADRLRRHGVRPGPPRRRHDLDPDPALSPADGSDRRGGGLHPRSGCFVQATQDRLA